MKRIFLALAAVLMLPAILRAQEAEKIALAVRIHTIGEDVPESVLPVLERKLMSIATANGIVADDAPFALVADVEASDFEFTTTAPVKILATVEVALNVIGEDKVSVGQTVISLKGVGTTKEQSVSNALSGINPKSSGIRRFMESMYGRIREYQAAQQEPDPQTTLQNE